MHATAFNQQVGLDRQGFFTIGRLPFPMIRVRSPWSPADPAAAERDFLGRYRAFLLDEMASVRTHIDGLKGHSASH